jgi:hypothetical protein
VAERRELRARPDRAEDEARAVRRGELVGGLAGQPRAGLGEFEDPYSAKLAELAPKVFVSTASAPASR